MDIAWKQMISDKQGVGVVVYQEGCLIVFILDKNAYYRMENHFPSSYEKYELSDYVKERVINLKGLEEALQNARNYVKVAMIMAA